MSDEVKRLKDPIYGYISVSTKILHEIIDTAAFQRLRRIRQTSYEPLYSAALHNRFIHSLGVYHLGKISSAALKKNILDGEFKNDWKDIWEDDFNLELVCIGVKTFVNLLEVLVGDVGVDLGGRDIGVTEEGLDGAQIGAVH